MRAAKTRRKNREASTLSIWNAGIGGRQAAGCLDVPVLSAGGRREAPLSAHSRRHQGTIPDRNRSPNCCRGTSALGQHREATGSESHGWSSYRALSAGGVAGKILHTSRVQNPFEKVVLNQVGRNGVQRDSVTWSRSS